MCSWVVRLDTQSAVSLCSVSSRISSEVNVAVLLAIVASVPGILPAQITTGTLAGTLSGADGNPAPGSAILISGGAGFSALVHSNSNGEFTLPLPYGHYRLSGRTGREQFTSDATVFVAPLQTTRIDLVIDASGSIRGVQPPAARRLYPEVFSLAGLLLNEEPSTVTEPLDFGGLSDNRLAVASQRGLSWTGTQYKFQGMDATDSWQPGRPALLPDVQALAEVVVRDTFAQTTPSSNGAEVSAFVAEPDAFHSKLASWHGALWSANTGAALSSTNLPMPAERGLVQQSSQFRWFTRDRVEIGGPLTRWADFYASGGGQWASQTEPLASPGTDQHSRLLFGNARGRVRATARDRFDALYSGSRIDLSDGGVPAGLEALTGNRQAPSFVLPGGFAGQRETDHLDFLQAGWTHFAPETSIPGTIEVRYGYSTANLDTRAAPAGQSRIELLGGMVSGSPPLANLAVRSRQGIEAAWHTGVLGALRARHQIVAGGGWKTSGPRNRFTAPYDMNLITADGAPALVVEFNTPLDSRELVRSFSGYFADHVNLNRSVSFDLGVFADFSRGSLPAQSSPVGNFSPVRNFAAQPDLIVWNNLSPRAGFAWRVPHSRGLLLQATYFRLYAPLAGRYLDFGNPNSLGGSIYQWTGSNTGGSFQRDEGNLLRFGGPYSSISPTLHRPYSDEFDIGAEFPLASRSVVSIHLFRRDGKDRIAAIDTGVPAQAFTPVSILDPGPDGIPGTFDDQRLTVYAQNPATLGQDRYLLTNPAGLRMLNTGLLAKAGTNGRRLTLQASFAAEKSYGPTNPGDSFYENDPGVVGALLLDPNTAINAAGRNFVDRAYVGKVQASYRLPPSWGAIEVGSVATYMDGLAFARRLLVTGLPQGPFLVATTARGSPGGGNRSEYVVDWDIRLSRQFEFAGGRFSVAVDAFNVTNAGQRLQEVDLSSTSFNLRLPVAIQPPRFARIEFRYEF
jgi:hypothetical protein